MQNRIEALKHDKEGAERLPSIEDALTRVQSKRLVQQIGMNMYLCGSYIKGLL